MPIALKFGSLNLLEPSEPVQACNGIALLKTKFATYWDRRLWIVWKLAGGLMRYDVVEIAAPVFCFSWKREKQYKSKAEL